MKLEDEDRVWLEVTDLSTLTREQMNRRNAYWFSRTVEERFGEMMRLNIARWGEEVFKKGMDKSKLEVIDMKTGEISTFYNTIRK